MKAIIVLALFLTACSQPSLDTAVEEVVEQPKVQEIISDIQEVSAPKSWTIVAVGDSLTAGYGVAPNEAYPAVLEQLLRERGHNVTVINAGISGERSAGTLGRIEQVIAQEPDIVIVETGINDLLNGIPPADIAANINAIIDRLQEEDITVVLAGMEAFGVYQGFSIQVRTMYPEIAAEQHVAFIPFFLDGVAGNPQYNQQDYLHPNAAGYRIIAEQNVLPIVEAAIERQ